MGVCVGHLFSNFVLVALYSSAIILLRKRAGCFALMWCGYTCSVSLPRVAVGRSAVHDCEMSWSYSFVERRHLVAIQVASSLYKYLKKNDERNLRQYMYM